MAPKKQPWFRFYVEACHDRKLRRLKPSERWLWVAVLAIARESPKPGWLLVKDGDAFTVEDIADFAGMAERDVAAGMDKLEHAGLVATSDGAWFVPSWDKRQFESDDVAQRTAKHRQRNVPSSFQGTPPETDTETDTSSASPSDLHPAPNRGQLLNEACQILAERSLKRTPTLSGNRARHLSAVTNGKLKDHRDFAFEVLKLQPHLSPQQLADKLEPEASRNGDRSYELKRDQGCPNCHGDIWIDSPTGAVPCPTCAPNHPDLARTPEDAA